MNEAIQKDITVITAIVFLIFLFSWCYFKEHYIAMPKKQCTEYSKLNGECSKYKTFKLCEGKE